MNQRFSLSFLSLNKTKDIGFMSVIMEKSLTESAGVTLQKLLLASFNKVKLDMSVNGLSSVGSGNSKEGTPFSIVA